MKDHERFHRANLSARIGGRQARWWSPCAALQQKVGDETFRAIERAWAQRERGRSVGTEDFIAVASDVAGRDLTDFLRAWVYDDTVPPMPNHADWTADPVTAAAARALSANSADRARQLELPQRQGGKTLPRY